MSDAPLIRRLRAVMCWCVAGIALAAGAQEQSKPFALGDSWTYRATQDGKPGGVAKETVRSVRGNAVELLVEYRNGTSKLWTYDQALQRYLVFSELTPDGRAGKVIVDFSACDPAIRFPFETGSTWTSKRRFKDAGSSDDMAESLNGKVVGRETIKTPAGEFDAYRIELDGFWADENWAVSSTRGRATERYWYVPAVKRFVRREIVGYGYTNGKLTGFKMYERVEELVSFRLADGTAGGSAQRMPQEFAVGTTRLIGRFVRVPGDAGYSGSGQMILANGDTYDGTLVNGVREGVGKATWSDGRRYEGDWRNDQPEGHGELHFANGDAYAGTVKAGVPDGEGTYTWRSGSRYQGHWSAGRKQGHGAITEPDGKQWEGEFVDDEKKVP